MNRRDFMKGAIVSSALLTTGKALARRDDYDDDRAKGKELNRLSNRDNPSELEQKHVPAIDVPHAVNSGAWIEVKVRVGFMKEHPATPEHWITKIKLLVNDKKVARTTYKTGGMTPPDASFRIRLTESSTLKAIENCNLHGTWESDPVEVKVS